MLCTTRQREDTWNPNRKPTDNQLYNKHRRNRSKKHQLEVIDMGTYCKINDITPNLLKVFVENGKRIVDVLSGNGVDISERHNKVVVMSDKEYEAYEQYKKFKAFQETQR